MGGRDREVSSGDHCPDRETLVLADVCEAPLIVDDHHETAAPPKLAAIAPSNGSSGSEEEASSALTHRIIPRQSQTALGNNVRAALQAHHSPHCIAGYSATGYVLRWWSMRLRA